MNKIKRVLIYCVYFMYAYCIHLNIHQKLSLNDFLMNETFMARQITEITNLKIKYSFKTIHFY